MTMEQLAALILEQQRERIEPDYSQWRPTPNASP